MPLRELAVSRLHCFRREARVRVAPITLIYGQNNAGKSTLLRALKLLSASSGAAVPAALDLSCEAARGASFHDLRSRFDAVNEVSFSITYGADVAETMTLRFMEEGDTHVLRDLVIHRGEERLLDLRVSLDHAGHYELLRRRDVFWTGLLPFSGVRPEPPADFPTEERAALVRAAAQLDALKSSVVWLTAIRAAVPRRGEVRHHEPRLGDGAWVQAHLAREVSQSRTDLKAIVSAELTAIFDCTLHVDFDDRDFLLRGSPGSVSWRVPLADLGEGITQVLPVIVVCCMAELGELGDEPILCIEQPEMHLHADAERKLAALLVRVAKSKSMPRLVLETHSEILLSAMLLEVASGHLDSSALALHWVSRESAATESVVRAIEVNAKGVPSEWPVSAFSERSDLARDLFLARRR